MICVLGMHRSGTSAVTGVLGELGVQLGPAGHLMLATADNPRGFFEHLLLARLNDQILSALGGNWHEPPPLHNGWEGEPGLTDLRQRAQRVLQEDFGTASLWGWKDPRICLTLPFWRSLLPSPRFVLCLRNPLDVARSLQVRNGFDIDKGIALWLTYTTCAIRHISGSPALLMAYEDIVNRADVETARLAAFLDCQVPDADSPPRAAQTVTDGLHHHRSALTDLFAAAPASYTAPALYLLLRSLAEFQHDDAAQGIGPTSLDDLVERYAVAAQECAGDGRREAAILRRELNASRVQAEAVASHLTALLDTCERARISQAQLLEYLSTPVGALKLSLRAWLPTPMHALLRRWCWSLFPGLFRQGSPPK